MRRHLLLCLLAVGFVTASVAANERTNGDPTFVTIDFPGGSSTTALDINAAGDIVGSYILAGRTRGYLLDREGQFFSIEFPGANFTRAAGINNRRDIVGTYRLPTDPMAARHGFLLSDGEFTTIDVPGARGTNAWKINSRGDIVGGYTDADGKKHAFVLGGHKRGFITIDAPGGGEIGVDNGGINSRREIVGIYCDIAPCRAANLDAHGFLLSRGRFTTIDFPGADVTNAFGINARGEIVGVYEDATGVHGFLLTGNGEDD